MPFISGNISSEYCNIYTLTFINQVIILSSMKIIILYKSISGFTEKYAKWIAKELGGDIKKQSEVNQKFLEKYDLIIYGGSLHASGIIGLKRINFLFTKLKNKKLIVFAVGASSPKKGVVDEIIPEPLGGAHRDHQFTAEKIRESIVRNLSELQKLSPDKVARDRYNKFKKMGSFSDGSKAPVKKNGKKKEKIDSDFWFTNLGS